MTFNSYASPTLQRYTSTTDSGTYYARSLVRFYTGTYNNNGPIYNIYNTPPTTYQSYSSNSATPPYITPELMNISNSYSINSKGETYGSALIADTTGQYPDLIAAEGINGFRGYVRFDDIDYSPLSIKDAIAHTSTLDGTIIPVYDIDGNIIDYFELSTTEYNNTVTR